MSQLDRFHHLQLSSNSMLNWFFQPGSSCIDKEPEFIHAMLVKQVYNSNSIIREKYPIEKTSARKYCIPKINKKKYHTDYLFPVLKICDQLRQLEDIISGFILHGSLATLDFIEGWSDVDAMIVVRDEALLDDEKIQTLRDTSYNIHAIQHDVDYHQHHGIHFITETDLRVYPDLYLPNDLFSESISLIDDIELDINIRNSFHQQVNRFLSIEKLFKAALESGTLVHHGKNGVYLKSKFRNADVAMYQLKYYLCVVMLLPSYFLNLLDISCTKKDSFPIIKKMIDPNYLSIVDKATEVRKTWDSSSLDSDHISQNVRDILGEQYFLEGYNLVSTMVKYLHDKNVIPGRL